MKFIRQCFFVILLVAPWATGAKGDPSCSFDLVEPADFVATLTSDARIDPEKFLVRCSTDILLNLRNDVAYINRAQAYAALGDYSKAVSDVRKALEINPKDKTALRLLPKFLSSAQSDPVSQLDNLSRDAAPKQSGDKSGYAGKDPFKDCTHATGDLGIAACTEVIRRNPRHAGAYQNRAVFHEKKGEREQAIADYTRAIEIKPEAELFEYRGMQYILTGKSTLALADYTRAIELGRKSTSLFSNRGYIYVTFHKDHARAIADFTKAIEIDPKYVLALENRASVYAHLGQHDNAVGDYTKAIALNSKNAMYHAFRGESYEKLGKKDQAEADYRQALKLDANSKPAAEGLKRLAASSETNSEEIKSDGGFLEEAKKVCEGSSGERAIKACTFLIKLSPRNDRLYTYRGYEYVQKEEYDLAVDDYTTAIELAPKRALNYAMRGLAYSSKREYARAADDANKAIELDNKLAIAYVVRGHTQEGLGKRDEAIAEYRKALAIDAGQKRAISALKRLGVTP